MLGFILSPIYLLLLIWFCDRFYILIDTLDINNPIILLLAKRSSWIVFILSLCIIIGFFLKQGKLKRILTKIGNYWLGISLYIFIGLGFSEIIRIILYITLQNYNDCLIKNLLALFIVLFTLIMTIYGTINSCRIRKTVYNIEINKIANNKSFKIAFISDVHLGYNVGLKTIKKTKEIIDSEDVDILLIGGDIFDNDFSAIENKTEIINTFKSIKTKKGTYAVLGNHDINEKIFCGFTFNNKKNKSASLDMISFLEDANIKLLYDEGILIDNVYLYGRPDYEKPNFNRKENDRKQLDEILNKLDLNKTIVILEHEPREYKKMLLTNIDLHLAGHTHAGQIWPMQYINHFIWDNNYGHKKINNFNGIVTSGLGLFGPRLRTGTKPEVCIINLKFTS